MLRIYTGFVTIMGYVASITMLITYGIMRYVNYLFETVDFDTSISFVVMIGSILATIVLHLLFRWLCKKENKRPVFRTLFKELAEQLRAITIMDTLYLTEGESSNEAMNMKVTELSELIAKRTESSNKVTEETEPNKSEDLQTKP